ncbi:hypothetical protein VTG60DRAFT_5979 [Thermothelomyces hinnuleus]
MKLSTLAQLGRPHERVLGRGRAVGPAGAGERNAMSVARHPSLQQQDTALAPDGGGFRMFQMVDITNEVIRDYCSEAQAEGQPCTSSDVHTATDSENNDSGFYRSHSSRVSDHIIDEVVGPATDMSSRNGLPARSPERIRSSTSSSSPTFDRSGFPGPGNVISRGASQPQAVSTDLGGSNDGSPAASVQTPQSHDLVQLAAVQLLDLEAGVPTTVPSVMDPGPPRAHIGSLASPLPQVNSGTVPETAGDGISPEPLFPDDGIFLPGSTYFELHSALRNHIFDTARSACPSRWPSPNLRPLDINVVPEPNANQNSHAAPVSPTQQPEKAPQSSDTTTPRFIELSKQEEYVLLKNWVDEIAPWLDKFDKNCHFQQRLPALAREHSHLRSSMLALSARQLERKHNQRSSSTSLALYQEAVHQLVPQLQTRLTHVVASCVVLCVLEMMSSEFAADVAPSSGRLCLFDSVPRNSRVLWRSGASLVLVLCTNGCLRWPHLLRVYADSHR